MDQATKAKFILALHKHSLKALDSGGGVVGGGGAGGVLPAIAGAFTTQNTYDANSPTSAATVGSQQATLAGQLQNEAAGNGPNPAQIMYEQNAQKIAQQQAGNYAANRALNPGLAARMAGNTAANVGQQAAGGAAAQQAEQQIAAQQQMMGLTGQEQQGVMYSQGINSQTAQNNTNAVNKTEGGLLSGIGAAVGLFEKGGYVHKMADGGDMAVPNVPNLSSSVESKDSDKSSGPTSGIGQILGSIMGGGGADAGSLAEAAPAAAMLAAKGGKVSAPNAKEKASVKDDSLKNDKIPALLSEGEIVIPRHISEHPQAAQKAAAFVQAVINKRKMGKR